MKVLTFNTKIKLISCYSTTEPLVDAFKPIFSVTAQFNISVFSKSPRYRTQAVNNGCYVTIVVTRQFPIVVGLFDCWCRATQCRYLVLSRHAVNGDYISEWHAAPVVHRCHRCHRCHSLSCTPAPTLSQVLARVTWPTSSDIWTTISRRFCGLFWTWTGIWFKNPFNILNEGEFLCSPYVLSLCIYVKETLDYLNC